LQDTGDDLHVVFDAMMHLAEQRLFFPQRFGDFLLRLLAPGDDLGEKKISPPILPPPPARDGLPTAAIPWSHRRAEGVLVAPFDRAGEDALVDVPPALGHFGKDLVVRSADDVAGCEVVILHPAVAGLHVAHARVQHGNGGGYA